MMIVLPIIITASFIIELGLVLAYHYRFHPWIKIFNKKAGLKVEKNNARDESTGDLELQSQKATDSTTAAAETITTLTERITNLENKVETLNLEMMAMKKIKKSKADKTLTL